VREQQIVIAGVGESRVARGGVANTWNLHLEAVERALEDGHVTLADVDGLISCPSTVDDHPRHHVLLAEHLGMPYKRYTDSSRVGGCSSTSAIRDAVMAIRAGLAEVVLISSADTQRSTLRNERATVQMGHYHYHSLDYEAPFGPLVMSLYALIVRRWMKEYGWTPEGIAEVAVAQRANAALHPDAQMSTPITVQDVLDSPPISTPLRMLDCSVISDGGAAMVVMTAERARAVGANPVEVLGLGNAYSYYFAWNLPDYTNYLRMLVKRSAAAAFKQAGISHAEVDLAFVGDPADFCTPIGLEGMGFAKPGEGLDFVADGRIQVGGALPTNTHGGCLSYAHPGAPGQHLHVIEAVRQLRGECHDRQVANARVAVVHGLAGLLTSHCTVVLGRGDQA
jgi:acetyl-CoA acetyltransferase